MESIEIENLKCGGCANTIKKGLNSFEGIKNVTIDVENSIVSFLSDDTVALYDVKQKLSYMGYPEIGESNSLLKKAKSYVSCAVGRIGLEE